MVVREAAEPARLVDISGVAPRRLRPTSTVGEVVQAAIADGLGQLLRFAPGVSGGGDPEDVHKSRVATRKMRSQLGSLSVAVDGEWLKAARSDLGWLAEGLGAVRDADVMIQRIHRSAATLPSSDKKAAKSLIARLEARRGGHARRAHSMMESRRYRSLTSRLLAAVSDPPVLAIGTEQATELGWTLLSASWRRLERSVEALPGDPADDDLHDVRIRAKRCRYTTEMLVPVVGGNSRHLARALADLQAVLGDIHDAHATETWLRAHARSRTEGLVAGMIIAAERSDHAALLGSWRQNWLEAQKVKPHAAPN